MSRRLKVYFAYSGMLVVVLFVPWSIVAQTNQGVNEPGLIYGLVLDNSGSMRTEIPRIKQIAKLIIDTNGPGDETFILRLVQEKKTNLFVDITPDRAALLAAVNSLDTEAGQTALIDGLYSAADYLSQLKDKTPNKRCALIVLSDGEDRASQKTQKQLLAVTKQMNCPIFFIGFIDELDRKDSIARPSPYFKARGLIEKLTKKTGGSAFFMKNGSAVDKLLQSLTKVLRY